MIKGPCRRAIVAATALLLTACVTSLDDIRNREVQDDLVSARSLPSVRDCLLATLGTLRTPVVLGNDQGAELLFSDGAAGVIFHYRLTAAGEGTRVEARRKNNIADGFNAARDCYLP